MLETKAELERAIAEAKEAGREAPDAPRRLHFDAIRQCPKLFQHRSPPPHASRQHIAELSRTPKSGKALTPVVIFWAGDRWVLIDGHHRMEAYRVAGWRKEIPVSVFVGTLDDAIGRAPATNHHAHLPMTNGERQNSAWSMLFSTKLTQEKISLSSGASLRNVKAMSKARKTLEKMGKPAGELASMSWHEARAAAKGETLGQVDWDAKDEKEAKDFFL